MSHWYPNRYDKMFGLFVQKHAEAVSIYCDVAVLYVHADENIKDFESIYRISENIFKNLLTIKIRYGIKI